MMNNNWLDQYDGKKYSQFGEDGKIEKILGLLPDKNQWCVEFGAWDGIFNSNTYALIKEKNYSAVLIEGSPEKFNVLKKNMDGASVHIINSYVGYEETNNLDNLLAKTPIPKDFDFISIDIDGNDFYVWQAFSEYRPKLVVIEFNPTIPDEVHFVQTKNASINHGCSIKALVELGKEKGYELVATTLNNAFFVDKKYFPLFEISDNSIEKLRTDKSRVTYIFNGYDGTVFVRGYGKVDLHNLPYNEKRMQMLPGFLRGFSDAPNGLGRFKILLRKAYKSLKKRGVL